MRKRLKKDITDKVEFLLIDSLEQLIELHNSSASTIQDRENHGRQIDELYSFLSNWGLDDIQLKNKLKKEFSDFSSNLVISKERDERYKLKSRDMLGTDIPDKLEETLIDALYELSDLYYGASKGSEEKKLYTNQYGELYIFLSGWGGHHCVDWNVDLPDDVMHKFMAEASKKDLEFKKRMENK